MADGGTDLAFAVLGRPVEATGVSDALARWLRSRWVFDGRGHPPAAHPFAISLAGAAAPVPPVPEGAALHVARLAGMQVPWMESAGTWWTGTPERGVRFSVAERLAALSRDLPGPDDGSARAPLDARDAVRVLWEAVGVPLTPAARAITSSAVGAFLQRVALVRLSIADDALPL